MRRGKGCRLKPRKLRCELLEPRLVLSGNDVVISEFMALNQSTIVDGDGDASDWIELFNTGSTPADLTGFYLTDNESDLDDWQFPAGTMIGPKSTLLVFASNKGTSGPPGELHTDFALSGGGEYLALVAPNGSTIVHQFPPPFPQQLTDVSYGLAMTSGQTTLVDEASPLRYLVPTNNSADATWQMPAFNDSAWGSGTSGVGYENAPGGTNDYTSLIDVAVSVGATTVYTRFSFNVADPSAYSTLNLGMIYDDGFAAYLNGTLVASANTPATLAWNSTAGTEPERGDEVVLADFVDFNLNAYLSLLHSGTNVLAIHALNKASSSDMLMIPQLSAGSAEIIEPRVTGFFNTPTPNAPNSQAFLGMVAPTQFSVERGFYTNPFALTITTATLGAKIVYTTNGSTPTVDAGLNITNGILYGGPLQIDHTSNIRAAAFKTSFSPTEVITNTYIFVNDVVTQTQQSALNAGFPSSWGSRSADYGLDPDVIGTGGQGGNDLFGGIYAGNVIKNSLLAIPTISLTISNADFFQSPNGIYANITQEGPLWERPVSAELIYPDGSDGFQINAGIRIHGAASRTLSKKNALRLLFKDDYGPSKLEYPLFGEDYVSEFDTIVLRPHFNDGWGWDGAEGDPLYIRDQWFRNTQEEMGHPAARGNVMHLYINGQYWGLYNPSERPDDSYAAEHFGGDKEEYDVVNHDGLQDGTIDAYNTTISMAQAVVSAATIAAKNAAYQLLQGNLPSGVRDSTKEVYLDIINYIDYMLLNHYGGNDDWPDRNWYANRRRGLESEGFRFYEWDAEISLDLSTRTDVNESYVGLTTGAAQLYGILKNYNEFRLQFADEIHKHLFNGGPLYVNPSSPVYDPAHPENNVPAARFDQLSDTVYDAMVAESARWGDQHVTTPRTRNVDWQNQLNYMLSTYFTNRHNIVLNQWRTSGLYPTTNAPELLVNGAAQHGGAVPVGAMMDFSNNNSGMPGTIYFTVDGSDPRLVGGAVNTASAQQFTGNIALNDVTRIKARILRNGEWSALTDATFIPGLVSSDNVVISEVNYNPYAPNKPAEAGFDSQDFEFIELLNIHATGNVDLAGLQLTGGVNFNFGSVILGPGERAVVVENQAAFEARYGTGIQVLGEWSGRLDNAGEELILLDALGNELASVNYENSDPWALSADGGGATLVLANAGGTPQNQLGKYYSWRGSVEHGGTPGADTAEVPGIVINELLTNGSQVADAIELFNPTAQTINVGGWYLSDSSTNLLKFQIPLGTILGAGQYITFDEADFNPTPQSPGPNHFSLNGSHGGQVWLIHPNGGGAGVAWFVDQVEYGASYSGESFGRTPDGSGRLTPLVTYTFDANNSVPRVGALVISEINYHPSDPSPAALAADPTITDNDLEYIEIHNRTAVLVDLAEWRLRGESDFDFAAGILAPGGTLLVVSFDPSAPANASRLAAFRAHYGIGASVALVGPFSGFLNNGTGRVELEGPDASPPGEPGFVPHITVDESLYDDLSPWPTSADGGGSSLQRLRTASYGNTASNWTALLPTPGAVNFAASAVGDVNDDGIVNQSDYLLWRASFGSGTTLNADANGNRQIDAADFVAWRNALSAGSSAVAAANIDGPASILSLESAPVSSLNIEATTNAGQISPNGGSGAQSEHGLSFNLRTAQYLQSSLSWVIAQQLLPKGLAAAVVDQVIVRVGNDLSLLTAVHKTSVAQAGAFDAEYVSVGESRNNLAEYDAMDAAITGLDQSCLRHSWRNQL